MQTRNQLWIMLFSGVMLHMICVSNFQFALTSMLKTRPSQLGDTRQVSDNASSMSVEVANQTNNVNVIKPSIEWADKIDIVLGSYSWFLGASRLIGGVLCQKYGGKTVFGFSNFLLAALDIMIPFSVYHFKTLVIIRSVQGFVGGIGGPQVCGIMCSKWVPQDERSKFMTISSGVYFGIAAAFLISSWIISLWNWQATFIVGGSGTLIWCVLWYYLVSDTPQKHPRISSQERDYIDQKIGNTVSRDQLPIPWKQIILSKPVLINIFCDISILWTAFTCNLYLPLYFKNVLGLKIYETGIFAALPYALHAIYAFTFGAFMDHLIRRSKLETINARKIAMFIGCILSGILFMTISLLDYKDTKVIIFVVTLAIVLTGSGYSGSYANVVDISPNFCSVLYGVQGFISSSTGYFAPLLTSYIIHGNNTIEQWSKVFQFVGSLSIVAGIVFILFGTSNVQPWNYKREQTRGDLLKKTKTPKE